MSQKRDACKCTVKPAPEVDGIRKAVYIPNPECEYVKAAGKP